MTPQAATLPLLLIDGRWTDARELSVVSREQGSPLERQMAVTVLGNLAHHQGQDAMAWAMVRELLPRGPDSKPEDGLFPYAIETLQLAVRLALDVGDSASAREWLATHERWLDWSGAVRGRAESQLLRARLHRLENNLPEAERCATEALRLASDPRQSLVLLETHRFLGQLLMDRRAYTEAETHLTHALKLADACEVPYERAWTLYAFADVYCRTGRAPDARRVLDEARGIADDLHIAPLVAAVEGLDARSSSQAVGFELTSREIDVLRLVADGLTDAEAAERLYISPRTVGQHLRSIYNKLGVSSRTQATRLAVQHQLF